MRKKRAEKRRVFPDPKYNDIVITRFINNLMEDGKRNIARTILYDALNIVRDKTGQDELEVFHKALAGIAPAVEVRSRRIGGATYQVPMEVPENRRMALAIRWLKSYASDRRDKTMAQRLASELMAAANGEGGAVRKRDDVHRMAEANRAFSHFKW
jgi:small subunit ribosomal protein S7